MSQKKFAKECMSERHVKWGNAIGRKKGLYIREDDIRTEFGRDYTRILHSTAYRRLKHKTQVFFATQNDHVCTRIEHVNHVASVSYTIAQYLGLNTELVRAIATGHDLGHAPFGHCGEVILREIAKEIDDNFWHERQGLHVVDDIETLTGPDGNEENMLLTYAVRDGIISHCGEVDENALRPRDEYFELEKIRKANQYQPFTWEACVVKISDKIAYLGRDIEDAFRLKIIQPVNMRDILRLVKEQMGMELDCINNTVLMHQFIVNLCEQSDPVDGLVLSHKYLELMNEIKKFNYENIYKHPRLLYYKRYAELIIQSIYQELQTWNKGEATTNKVLEMTNFYPTLGRYFLEWLQKYSDLGRIQRQQVENRKKVARNSNYNNKVIYNVLSNNKDYQRACVDFIAGMTDSFAEKIFKELTCF